MKKKPKSCSQSSTSSQLSTVSIQNVVDRLIQGRIRDSTKRNYRSVWKQFNEFFIRLDIKPTAWEDRIVLFAGHLINEQKQSQTVKSYVSAIKGVLRNDGVVINEDRFLLNSLTRACKLSNDRVRTRLPIRKPLLHMLATSVTNHYEKKNQPYLGLLYKAIFVTAYHGMFRIGELTTGEHPVRVTDVQMADNKCKLLFILRTSKTHGLDEKPQLVKITKIGTSDQFCPYFVLKQFLLVRPNYLNVEEPFFVFSDRSPVTPKQVGSVLHRTLKDKGITPSLYGTHSFRLGMSQDLLAKNISVEKIRFLGRWKSNVVFKYLR